MTTGRKLVIAGVLVAGVTGYMAYLGAATSWQYYVTPEECLADPAALRGDRIRVSGKIAAGRQRLAANRGRSCRSRGSAGRSARRSRQGTPPA